MRAVDEAGFALDSSHGQALERIADLFGTSILRCYHFGLQRSQPEWILLSKPASQADLGRALGLRRHLAAVKILSCKGRCGLKPAPKLFMAGSDCPS